MAEVLREQAKTLWEGVSLHLAIAFFVAGWLILGVEGVARFRARGELREHTEAVSRAVWKAIFGKLVPAPIERVIEGVLKSPIVRLRPRYVITFRREPYSDVPAGRVVVRRELYYRLKNITGEAITHPVSVRVISHTADQTVTAPSGARVTLPAIRNLRIAGDEIPIHDRQTVTVPTDLPSMDDDNEALEVVSVVEELLETSDRALYVLTMPSCGLEVTIVNEIRDLIEVAYDKLSLTSGTSKLRKTTEGSWICEEGLLPGTALEVSWKARQPHLATPLDEQG